MMNKITYKSVVHFLSVTQPICKPHFYVQVAYQNMMILQQNNLIELYIF